ncbi:KRI1-like family C-terminal-domain-containing protein [Coprinopsis sp. MPI-PUGE-AT-0042]|nr:KRI1-like family C-terminal-domain-containing protein [Coprinopsis sp. MPI-PUGE-AT-0042]
MFSDSDNESSAGGDNVQLTVNEHYAKAFNYRKEREELEKYSESAESEDEDGEELTPAVDAAILRTLARIRKKDPAIYDSSKSIFGGAFFFSPLRGQEEEKVVARNAGDLGKKNKEKKTKPVTLRQANLDAVLRGSRSPSPSPSLEGHEHQPTHVEEQRALRQETIAAFHGAVSDDDDLLVPREKTKDEIEAEEEEYRAYLERQVGEDLGGLISVKDVDEEQQDEGNDEKKKTKKKDKSKKKEKEKRPKFLLDYILNRGWIDQSSKRVPTYNEITSTKRSKGKAKAKPSADSSSEGGENDDNEDPGLLSDTSFTSLADIFELSYNHRFEEPNAAIIPSFPRQIESTVRRDESKRKEARERRKARKEEELRVRKEEVRRMKALKMKEVKRRLERIARESGMLKHNKKGKREEEEEEYEGDAEEEGLDVEAALQELDLEGEWDPEKHDRQMEGLFANEQDEGEEEVQYDDDGKPVWNDDIDIGDIHVSEDDAVPTRRRKKKKKKKGGEDEDGGVDVDMMDAEHVVQPGEEDEEEEWDGTEEMRKRKWNEYMAQLDEMDFNDMVGGMPTRFKYVPIPTQTYSLDPVEILLADDKDLNEYMSIKKYAPYRKEKGDRARWDPKQKEKLQEFKNKVREREVRFFGSSVSGDGRGEVHERGEGGEKPKKKRKGKKERMKMKEAGGDEDEGPVAEDVKVEKQVAFEQPEESNTSKKKKRKREEKEERIVDDEDAASKKKRRRRHGKKTATEES